MRLSADHRFAKFAARYAFDIARFAIEVVGMQPTWQQLELFTSAQAPGSRTSIASGHGTGKSRSIGVLAIWHLLCYKDSITMLTGPKYDQIKNIAWKEMNTVISAIKSGPHAWVADYIIPDDKRVYIRNAKATWYIYAKTAPSGSPENLAGDHGKWLFVIADEATGIPDANFGVIGGMLTDERNRMMICSQPTRPMGFFRDTHHKLSKREYRARGEPDTDGWTALTFSSEDSPLVSRKFIREKIAEYGGRDDPQYQIKVLGKFPEQSNEYLLSRKHLDACINAPLVIEDSEAWGWVLSVDVAGGEGRDSSVATLARVIGVAGDRNNPRRVDVMDIPIFSNRIDPASLAAEVFQLSKQIPNCTILVDSMGLGLSVYHTLKQLGAPSLSKIVWGKPCWQREAAESFSNLRSQAIVTAARAIKDGRLTFPNSKHKKEFLDQGCRIPYGFDGNARYKIMSKDDMKSAGIKSPDLFDTIAHFFMLGVSYIPAEEWSGDMSSEEVSLSEQAEAMFADLD